MQNLKFKILKKVEKNKLKRKRNEKETKKK
jgi:hypothetical protein